MSGEKIEGIKQSNVVTWEKRPSPKKCSFDGHKTMVDNVLRDVISRVYVKGCPGRSGTIPAPQASTAERRIVA